eukprot:TRINITY_DN2291_c0_g1_i1.p2 TRINITY_DN2291_c0_g1~~TRINITY_DN2291_c0_g1_i1.p2  ORF type:complete len:178 (+),score=34.29 TRINITY_DN2291_c0_g1_i1:231-764(+)
MSEKEKKIHDMETSKSKVKQQKMPLPMLQGIRKKVIKKEKEEEERKRNENILYDSGTKKHNTFFKKKLDREKEKRARKGEYSSYKYKGNKTKTAGSYKQGVLSFSNKFVKNVQKQNKHQYFKSFKCIPFKLQNHRLTILFYSLREVSVSTFYHGQVPIFDLSQNCLLYTSPSPRDQA